MSSQLHDDSYLVVNNQDVAAKVVDGEAILINLTSGLYYSMDKVGGFVWSMFEPGSSVAQIADAVAVRYSVPPAQAREDVRRLARELLEENLVTVSTGTPGVAPPAGTSAAKPQPYVTPTLVRFDDMADMFALDPPLPELPAVRTGSA